MSAQPARRFEAVIFDLDGVLVDSEPVHYAASLRLVAPGQISPEEYARFTGIAMEPFLEWLEARFGLGLTPEQAIARYTRFVTEEIEGGTLEPLDGARELIAAARESGLAVGLGSQSVVVWVDATLRSASLDGLPSPHAQPAPRSSTASPLPTSSCWSRSDSASRPGPAWRSRTRSPACSRPLRPACTSSNRGRPRRPLRRSR